APFFNTRHNQALRASRLERFNENARACAANNAGIGLPPLRPVQKSSIIQTLLVFRQRIRASIRESGDGMAVSPKSPAWRQITRALPFRSPWTIRASGPLSTETNKPSPLLVHDTGPTAGHPLVSRNVRPPVFIEIRSKWLLLSE